MAGGESRTHRKLQGKRLSCASRSSLPMSVLTKPDHHGLSLRAFVIFLPATVWRSFSGGTHCEGQRLLLGFKLMHAVKRLSTLIKEKGDSWGRGTMYPPHQENIENQWGSGGSLAALQFVALIADI
eukprot:1156760-Pelagomonas_calceolata.AAC.2